ncbi:MAG: spore coat U domain-containing protein [Luteimonas sp.]|nr:spore coat U domain-containing protein [Luteimonas sp.]
MNMFKSTLIASALVLAGIAAAPAQAAVATATFKVSITLQKTCTVAVGDINFGTVASLATAVDASSNATVTCTANNTPYTMSFNAGTGTGSTLADRKLKLETGAETISYNLYSTASRNASEVLGDGTSSTVVFTGTGGTAATSHTVYGRVAGSQAPTNNGVFSSNVVATITY